MTANFVKGMTNAGKYNKKIAIYKVVPGKDAQGFVTESKVLVLEPYAQVKTLKGIMLLTNDSDFERAYINFTIRYSQTVENAYYEAQNSNRNLLIVYGGKDYNVEYLNNINLDNIELELQAKEILK